MNDQSLFFLLFLMPKQWGGGRAHERTTKTHAQIGVTARLTLLQICGEGGDQISTKNARVHHEPNHHISYIIYHPSRVRDVM